MNHIDLILALPLAYGAFRGFVNGMVMEVASLVGLIAGVFLAAIFADVAAQIVEGMLSWNPMIVKIIVFVIIFVTVVILIKSFAKFVEKLFKITGLNIFNRIAGIVGGTLKFAFILSVFLIFFNHLNRNETFMNRETQDSSFLYKPVSAFAPAIIPGGEFLVWRETIDRMKRP